MLSGDIMSSDLHLFSLKRLSEVQGEIVSGKHTIVNQVRTVSLHRVLDRQLEPFLSQREQK